MIELANEVKVIRELKSRAPGQSACLVRKGNKYYVVSTVEAAFDTNRPETLAFECDEHGEWTGMSALGHAVAGAMSRTREEVIAELERRSEQEMLDYHENRDALVDYQDGLLPFMVNTFDALYLRIYLRILKATYPPERRKR